MKDTLDVDKEIKAPTCWICKDGGLVFYFKILGGISYDFAYRCTCILGQASSHRIGSVPVEFAEKIAAKNYRSFGKIFKD